MYTEIKEVCNFLVRYLRYRIPCQTLKDYLEHLANMLIVTMEPTWNTLDERRQCRINVLHWFANGTTSEVFYKAARQSGMNPDYMKVLLPEKLIFAISPGLVTYQSTDDPRPRPIWEGEVTEDLDYDPSPLCTKVIYEPPCVTISKTRGGNVLYGKPLVMEDFSEAPAFLTDPMMPEAHFVMLLTKVPRNSYDYEYLKDYEGKIFKVERYVAPRQVPEYGLIPVSQFHNTRFGSFRTNIASPPRILDVEEDTRSLAAINENPSPPPTPHHQPQVDMHPLPPWTEKSSPSSSAHSSTEEPPTASKPSLDLGPLMEVPIKVLQQILNSEQKRVLRLLNYPCD
uniref:Anti_prolifrtn domain-containing protein n=1 Tax=Panagrellus redivivus TaxID=6233 RepID=A0A7E4ZXK6_PANRE